MMEAMLYEKMPDGRVTCHLCAHECRLKSGTTGICGVRENRDGTLYTHVGNRLIAESVDPIEKKPLFHFLPGTMSYSVATVGCNFRCTFCQNHDISQLPKERGIIQGKSVSPEVIPDRAKQTGCRSISYTYTEPTVFFELCYWSAVKAVEKGLANVFVTNGYMTSQALETIHPHLTAANVDLKSFRDEFYRKYCGAKLQPVLKLLEKMKSLGIWIEVTTLIIPGLNDSDEELSSIARFIHNLSPDIPWHVSRFYPRYKMTDVPPTPPETVYRARAIGRNSGLKYVYCGNLPGREGEDTHCPHCDRLVIERWGFQVTRYELKGGCCPHCGTPVAGVW